jgi:hypothetical protein
MSFVSGQYATQAQRVLKENEKLGRFNTKKAYDPKIEEFKEFCNDQFSHHDFPSCVTEENTFAFLMLMTILLILWITIEYYIKKKTLLAKPHMKL